MKRWIKRTLVGIFGAAALFGGLAAYANHRGGGCHGWHAMGETDSAAMRTRMVDRMAQRLALDAAQKAKLATLAERMHAQHQALLGGAAEPGAAIKGLVAGTTFDRTQASALVAAKLDAIKTGSPAVIDAMADFYDSLKPEQQAQVRAIIERRHHG
ncbi:MAG: Spy/CpxP family protein refolding chaperone [Burkholderiales bacterium]|nr:Spy/CpxP family protein refolding chaperone [Burkholderiales bacterium]